MYYILSHQVKASVTLLFNKYFMAKHMALFLYMLLKKKKKRYKMP